MKKTIIFATNNENKVKEVRSMLANENFNVITLKEAGIIVDIEETGKTFEENALIKARYIYNLTNNPTIADDSGLEIEFLDGAPGVYSSRFMGEDTPYEVKNAKIIEKLKDAKEENRGAAFRCVMAFISEDGKEYLAQGTMNGQIAKEIRGANGFGYDPIFYVKEHKKTSAELLPAEKNAISHRGCALRKLKEIIKEHYKL